MYLKVSVLLMIHFHSKKKKNDGVEEELQNTANDLLDDDPYIYHSQDKFDVPISQSIFISD